jgi:GNAT superfamily N-acetyltransferase
VRPGELTIRRLTPGRMDDLGAVLKGGWGAGCWCMEPRLTTSMLRELPGEGSAGERRRAAMTRLARRRRAPGLLGYLDGEVVGWCAIAPRSHLARVDGSRATPRVDDVDVWVIPCITVRRAWRGRGVAVALIRAAVELAASQGAPAVEAHPRADRRRIHDDFAHRGTVALFRKAGFRRIRGPLAGRPKNWAPRATMRVDCGGSAG